MRADPLGIAVVQPPEMKTRDIRRPGPGRFVLRPGRDQDQPRPVHCSRNRAIEQLQRCRIAPMRILQHEQDRVTGDPPIHDAEQCALGDLFSLLDSHGLERRPRFGRDRQQISEDRLAQGLCHSVLGQQAAKLVAPRRGAVAAVEAGGARELL